MNIEDMIAYDALTKEYKNSGNQVINEIDCNKEITSTAYTRIATICPVLKGTLGIHILFSKNLDLAHKVWISIVADNQLIEEKKSNTSSNVIDMGLSIEQPLTAYEIFIKNDDAIHHTVTNIQLTGEILDTGKLYLPIQLEE